MLNYIENLRKKPEHERKKAVLFISVSITVIIAIIWGVFITMRVSHADFSIDTSKIEKPGTSLSETFSDFFEQAGNLIQGLESVSSEATSSAPVEP